MEFTKPKVFKLCQETDSDDENCTTGSDQRPQYCIIGSDPKEHGCTNGGSHSNFCATGADPG